MQTEAQGAAAFLERARDMLFLLDGDGRFQWANPAAERLLGVEATTLEGKHIAEVLPDAGGLGHLQDGEQHGPHVIQFEATSGPRWLELSAWSVGEQVQGVARDITLRRQYQQSVRDGEQKFRAWLEQVPLGVYRTSADGRILDGNQALADLFGAPSMAALKRRNAAELFAEGQGRARNVGKRLFRGDVQIQDIQLKRLDGTTFWARDVGRVIRDEDDKILFFDGTLEDVTQERSLAQDVEASETKFRSLVDQLPVGVYRSRPDGTVEQANPALLVLLGCHSMEELSSANDLYVHPDDRDDWLDELQQRKGIVDREFLMRRHDGTQFWVRDVASAITDASGEIVSVDGSIQDITKRKRAEATVALVLRVSRAIAEADDFEDAVRGALQAVCDSTGWSYGEAWIPGPGGDVLLPSKAWVGKQAGMEKFRHLTERLQLVPGEGVAGEAWAERRIGYHPDLIHLPTFMRAAAAQAVGLRAGVFVPVMTDGRVAALLGFLTESLDEEGIWLDALHAIGSQVGSMFARRQLEDQVAFHQMLLNAQMEASGEAVLSLGVDGAVLAANQALLDLCGAKQVKDGGGVLERLEDPNGFLTEVAKLYTGASHEPVTIEYRGRVLERRAAPIASGGRLHGRVWTFREVPS